jgi:hypothetical protein
MKHVIHLSIEDVRAIVIAKIREMHPDITKGKVVTAQHAAGTFDVTIAEPEHHGSKVKPLDRKRCAGSGGCTFSKAMGQPSPRLCVDCGFPEYKKPEPTTMPGDGERRQ